MDFSIILRALPDFLDGTKNTIIYCVSSFALALLLGLVLALVSGSKYTWLRGPARIYIEVIRSTPMIAQMFLMYYGLSTILFNLSNSFGWNNLAVYVNGWTAGIAALSLNYAAYEAEVFRAGFLSVERGQTEAALSLGLNSSQNFIKMLKDSAIVSVIAGTELTSKLDFWRITNGSNTIPLFILAMALYLVLSLPTSYFARWYERKLRAAL